MTPLNNLKWKSGLWHLVLTGVTVFTLISCFGAKQDKIQTELLSKDIPDGGKQYAVRLKNYGKKPIYFEALPDGGFAHSACTYGSVFATSISSWNPNSKLWEPRDTFINGVKASSKGAFATHAFVLQPGDSLCAGWWADSDNVKAGEEIKMAVCTSFKAESRCFTSPSFRVDGKAKTNTQEGGQRDSAKSQPLLAYVTQMTM